MGKKEKIGKKIDEMGKINIFYIFLWALRGKQKFGGVGDLWSGLCNYSSWDIL